jgi:hypothetical protein
MIIAKTRTISVTETLTRLLSLSLQCQVITIRNAVDVQGEGD